MTLTVNVSFEIVSVIMKFAQSADWVEIALSQETKVRVQTNVRVKECNTRSLKVAQFASKQSFDHNGVSTFCIFVDSACKLSLYTSWLMMRRIDRFQFYYGLFRELGKRLAIEKIFRIAQIKKIQFTPLVGKLR